tara:strand:- start:211717 stop:211878 length:162 start_codon:yes stop_codon:yes gene_type:complete
MFGSSKGEEINLGRGVTLFVPAGYKVCTGCGGQKTKTFGSACMACNGQGYVRK